MAKQHIVTAIITDKRGRVLSIGKNSYSKSHPYMKELATKQGEPYKCFLHAEISAIIRCRDLTKAHKITIIRLNSRNEPMLAKPCPICQSAIDATGIKVIEYTERLSV